MSENKGRNIENLRMWQPGESGNPAGRPRKAYSLTQMLREYGERVDVEGGPTRAQQLAEVMWKAALKGDRDIAKYIIDRMDGKPKERLEMAEDRVNRVVYEVYGGDTGTDQSETSGVPSQQG